jgi:cobalt-zinc-cadmium efflux system membrane fusion protein
MRIFGVIISIVLAALPFAACRKGDGLSNGAGARAAQADEQDRPAETEISDLDLPVDTLFSLACEHGLKTYECGECRYEVGVVKAPAGLFADGLFKDTKVARRRVEQSLTLTGEVGFDERRVRHLSAPADGIIRRVHTVLGDRLTAGQPILELESVAAGEAQGDYLAARALLTLVRRNHDRVAELQREGIASEREFFEARQELEAADIRVGAALGKLMRLGMSAEDAAALTPDAARGLVTLRASASGTVLSLQAVPGKAARPDESLAVIGDNSTVWVWVDLYERDLERAARSCASGIVPAALTTTAYPGETFSGTVDFISPVMEETSRTAKLRVKAPNPGGRLLAGMFVTVRIFLPGDEETAAVPETAVLVDEGRAFVFVHHHDDYYVRRPVETGRTWPDWTEIVAGLAGGETIVADGSFLMKSDVLRSKMGAGCAD